MDEIKKLFALDWEIRERIEECEEITIYTVHILLVVVYYIHLLTISWFLFETLLNEEYESKLFLRLFVDMLRSYLVVGN
jgi:hypothetical protein